MVHWKPRAISHLKKQAAWYAENMGISAANKFWNGMIAAVDLLSINPYLRKIEPLLTDLPGEYRSLVKHKDYKIIYKLNIENNIEIVAIWHCHQNRK